MTRGSKQAAGAVDLGKARGKWVADYVDVISGKRCRRKIGMLNAMSRADATRELQRFKRILAFTQRVSRSPSIGEIWELWLQDRADDGYKNNVYASNWAALAPTFAHLQPAALTKLECKEYARARVLIAGKKAWTAHTELNRLRSCLNWAAGPGKLLDEAVHVWVPPSGPPRKITMAIDDVRRLLIAAQKSEPHTFLFCILLFVTGQRHQAILELTWSRVDWATGVIHFDDGEVRDPLSRGWKKGRASVPMNQLARATLERAYAVRRSDFVVERDGARLRNMRESFGTAVKRAGLNPKITPHVMRHTLASRLAERGIDTKRVGRLLGHAPGSKVTESVYTHSDPSAVLRDVVNELELELPPI